MVCLLTLIPITKVVTTYHIIKFHDRRECTKPNINVFIIILYYITFSTNSTWLASHLNLVDF
jgi:hypothetical protein